MRTVLNTIVVVVALSVSILSVAAQTPSYPNVGRAATDKEIRDWSLIISRDGKELLPGSGNAKQGAVVFVGRGCAQCHGPDEKHREAGLRMDIRSEATKDRDGIRAIVPGKPFTVGLLLRMAPGWHTYWKFSGDAGLPTELKWKLPPGWKIGDIQWPIPLKTVDPGDIGQAVTLYREIYEHLTTRTLDTG